MSKKHPLGVVYSTNPDYQYQYDDDQPYAVTPPPSRQRLRVTLDHRANKTVTLVSGFKGSDLDLQALAKTLKTHCAVGGSAKDGEIIIQGDHLEKVRQLLAADGYTLR